MLGILSKSDAKFNISCQNYAIHEGVSYDEDIENKDCTTFFLYIVNNNRTIFELIWFRRSRVIPIHKH